MHGPNCLPPLHSCSYITTILCTLRTLQEGIASSRIALLYNLHYKYSVHVGVRISPDRKYRRDFSSRDASHFITISYYSTVYCILTGLIQTRHAHQVRQSVLLFVMWYLRTVINRDLL